MKKDYFQKGFTLIELLVVISIIGVLASIVLVSLDDARIKTRDIRRKTDLHALELAVQLYYDSTGAFPINATTGSGDWPATYKTQASPYISKLPLDPLVNNGGRYYGSYRMTWSSDPNCNGKYVLWAYLEKPNSKQTCGWGSNHYFRVLGNF